MGGCLTRRLGFGSTPAPGGGTDPNWSSVVLMVGANGTNNSTTIPDESPAAHGNGDVSGLNNDACIKTGVKKFGTGSLHFDGTNDVCLWADHADWEFGSGAFTVECWALFNAGAIEAFSPLVAHYEQSGNQRAWYLAYRGDAGTNSLTFSICSDGTAGNRVDVCSSAWTPTADTWYHIAADRSGNTFRLYVNGTMLTSGSNAMTIFNSTNSLKLGAVDLNFHTGNLDEVRITKGVARYASDGGFTAPTAAFPRS